MTQKSPRILSMYFTRAKNFSVAFEMGKENLLSIACEVIAKKISGDLVGILNGILRINPSLKDLIRALLFEFRGGQKRIDQLIKHGVDILFNYECLSSWFGIYQQGTVDVFFEYTDILNEGGISFSEFLKNSALLSVLIKLFSAMNNSEKQTNRKIILFRMAIAFRYVVDTRYTFGAKELIFNERELKILLYLRLCQKKSEEEKELDAQSRGDVILFVEDKIKSAFEKIVGKFGDGHLSRSIRKSIVLALLSLTTDGKLATPSGKLEDQLKALYKGLFVGTPYVCHEDTKHTGVWFIYYVSLLDELLQKIALFESFFLSSQFEKEGVLCVDPKFDQPGQKVLLTYLYLYSIKSFNLFWKRHKEVSFLILLTSTVGMDQCDIKTRKKKFPTGYKLPRFQPSFVTIRKMGMSEFIPSRPNEIPVSRRKLRPVNLCMCEDGGCVGQCQIFV